MNALVNITCGLCDTVLLIWESKPQMIGVFLRTIHFIFHVLVLTCGPLLLL